MVTLEGEWIKFSFFRPGANRVCLAGDFNGWRPWDIDMTPDKHGNWSVRVKLSPGEFRFRYCADGEWFADYAAHGVEPGRFGMDSILTVPSELPVAVELTARNAEALPVPV